MIALSIILFVVISYFASLVLRITDTNSLFELIVAAVIVPQIWTESLAFFLIECGLA